MSVTTIRSNATPDGAPWGLYLYDTEDVRTVSAASLTYWILGSHATSGTTAVTWTAGADHSACWGAPRRLAPRTKADGLVYTGYRWTYACAIDPHATRRGEDGVDRAFLGEFVVATDAFEQPTGSCGKLNVWTERSITIDGVVYGFERRAGTDGSCAAPRGRSARGATAPEGPSTDVAAESAS